MSRCTDLGSAEHKVLRALDSEGRGVKRRKARVTPAQIAQGASLPSPRVLTCLDELVHLGFVERADEGTYLIFVRCTCKKTDSSIPAGGRELAERQTGLRTQKGVGFGTPAEAGYPLAARHACVNEKYSDEQELCRPRTVKRRGLDQLPVERWNGYHLALHFQRALRTAGMQQDVAIPPSAVNVRALSSQFASWRREGYGNALIREMTNIFCEDLTRWRRASGKDWWKTFLNKRSKLFDEASARFGMVELKGSEWTTVRQLKDVDWLS